MKTIAKRSLIILLTAAGVTSCTLSKTEWVNTEDYSLYDFSQLDSKTCFIPDGTVFASMDEETVSGMQMPGGYSVGQIAKQEEQETKTTSTNGTGVAKTFLSMLEKKKVISYSGSYMSHDEHGDPVRLSGRVILPASGKVSRIMLVSHFTIGADCEAPSMELPLESIFAANGIAVVEPDYIGYGLTAGRIHPYLCAKVTANNVIDMYFSTLPFLRFIGRQPENPDIFLLGFSQGGAVTLSVAQELEISHFDDVKVRLAMCGSGPYDICATYDTLIDNNFTDYPCAIPMIIQGMNVGMGLNLDYSKFFTPRMLENMDEWLNSKKYAMADITTLMGSKKISDIMTKEAMDKSKDLMSELYRAMLENSATQEMMPDCPIYLFHSLDDNVVPFVNAYNLEMELTGYNVTYNFGHYGNHVKSCLRFLGSCMTLLKDNGDLQ